MKKIAHLKYNFFITLEENRVNELVIENPSVMSELVQELSVQYEGENGNFVLSEVDKILSIEKTMVFVKDPFSIDVNQRKILSKLYSELGEYVNAVYSQEKDSFIREYIQYMNYICGKSELFLDYDAEPDIQDVFKLAKIKIDSQAENLLNRIVECIKVFAELLHQEIFVFLNLKLYFTKEEISTLYKECFYRKIHLILIEAVFEEKLTGEKVCIIDRDKCIFYP